ncbi:hypothetical protein [Breoghania sp. JC706]|uniref:hypothetical protein n=1 Tax=Breoghania sp. JC706 TaxID=3117732 RepID=UPI00300BB549
MTQGRDGNSNGADSDEVRKEALRQRTLARLIGGETSEGGASQRLVVARLARALRGERRRGLAGHWTYDLNRHIALLQAYRAERALLKPTGDSRLSPPPEASGSATASGE